MGGPRPPRATPGDDPDHPAGRCGAARRRVAAQSAVRLTLSGHSVQYSHTNRAGPQW
ncbi:hypothetical protein ACFFX0_16800 [Citricoccus parietis]|uniref:Uncharacterized protein n=1 Tax=Citricoccus parietis TaxID=592307 RepID=A0ABV5G1I4_9MICC